MNARRASPLLLALLGTLPATAACYDLNKVPTGPRWIDDFSASKPTWSVFAPWRCGSLIPPPTGHDGGVADGGQTDGGRTDAGSDTAVDAGVSLSLCPLVREPDDTNALDPSDNMNLTFTFDIPEDMGVQDAIVQTVLLTAGPVDFTGFRQLVFSLKLSTTNPSPAGTGLSVVLGCSRNGTDKSASQTVPATMYTLDSTAWWPIHLDVSLFYGPTSLSQACLSQIDSISFLVPPGTNDLPSFDGTLSLDNISLQND